MANGILSKGISLRIKDTATNLADVLSAEFEELVGLQDIPDIGGSASDSERVDITTLADSKRQYIAGIQDEGEGGDSLDFTFVYNPNKFDIWGEAGEQTMYAGLKAVSEALDAAEETHPQNFEENYYPTWNLELSDGSVFEFQGKPSVRINGVGVNEALGFTLTVSLYGDMAFTAA